MGTRRLLALVGVAALALASCSGGGDSKKATTATATPSGGTATAVSGSSATPIATTREGFGALGTPYQLDILALQRTGDHVTLRFALTDLKPSETPVITNDFVDRGGDEAQQKRDADSRSFSGVYVIDDVNSKKYFPLRDAEGNCVCSGGIFQIVGRTELYATFPAPPTSVKAVTVSIPQFGAFPNLRIT